MTNVKRASFWFVAAVMVLMGYFKLATPLIVVMFSYLLLRMLNFQRRKWLSTGLFLILVIGIFTGFGLFIQTARNSLPNLVEDSLPKIIELAKDYGVAIPFSDMASFKEFAVGSLREELGILGLFVKGATKEFVYFIIGVVIAIAIFYNSKIDLDVSKYELKNNYYSLLCAEIEERFRNLYKSFRTVIGAQLIISSVNTTFTMIFMWIVGMPHIGMLGVATFLCGLFPIIGNIISNSIIFSVGITVSTSLAIEALIYLIVIHKFEYFLNSKIIGSRISNPMWLTLVSLLVGEQLMGIPGMILAPVVLSYIKTELSTIPA